MKYIWTIIVMFVIFGFVLLFLQRDSSFQNKKSMETNGKMAKKEKQYNNPSPSLFVPYWTITGEVINEPDYKSLLYFGIGVDQNGIDTKDQGYRILSQFEQARNNAHSLLVIRMIDSKTNFKILDNKNVQKKIISESIRLAREYGFYGVVLDLEVSSLPFSSIVDQINTFVADFATKAHEDNLSFSITLFGDTFSKVRPYDVSYLSKKVDGVYIMAYDFHKSGGNPGPNFPLQGSEVYGYDFKTMINDFLQFIPPEKITVVFGMFGYDWTVDTQGDSIGQADPLSLLEIQKKFFPECIFLRCEVARDEKSKETHITYTDSQGDTHSVWFEDENSTIQKQKFLREKGISSFSYWAYSFFN